MIILGINNMHDASAALVIDGTIIAAAEEERFVRIKHRKGFPKNAIKFCLDYSGTKIDDIDIICASWKPWILWTRATQAVKSIMKSPNMFKAKTSRGMSQMKNEWAELFTLKQMIEHHFTKGKFQIKYVDHHLSHAASAFLCSPFDKAAILTVDGAGEADTTVLWVGEGTKIKKLKVVRLPYSIGQFYSSVTEFLGFKSQSDEYKVMGLASYGEPIYADYLRKNVIRIIPNDLFDLDPYFIDYHLARNGIFRKTTTDIFGKPREKEEGITKEHANIAASAQSVVEEVIFHLVNQLYEMTKLDNLCLAGGVAFNCVTNGKLFKRTPFKNIFVQPAAGDAGSALGAAFYLEHLKAGRDRGYILDNAYFGPSYPSEICEKSLKDKGIPYNKLPEDILLKKTAKALAAGKLVFWFQGRMEWGPRALGNRSLLADPRRDEMKDIINLRIKIRERFRPFAPSVLAEKSSEYFDNQKSSPFMLFTFNVRDDKRKQIPAVTHVDGTARPQTVHKETNPVYWKLLKEFEKLSKVPMVLNTSFNVQEPIVCSPQDAIDCFTRTKADCLVLNNLFIERPFR